MKFSFGRNKEVEQICNSQWKGIYTLIYRAVQNQTEAEDLTQEVFLRAIPQLTNPNNNIQSKSGYLRQIAKNLIKDKWRSKTQQSKWLEVLLNQPYMLNEDSEDRAVRGLDQELLLQKINQLGPDASEVLKLRFFEDLTSNQIAQRMNKNVDNIRQIQRRGLQQLKSSLNSEDMK